MDNGSLLQIHHIPCILISILIYPDKCIHTYPCPYIHKHTRTTIKNSPLNTEVTSSSSVPLESIHHVAPAVHTNNDRNSSVISDLESQREVQSSLTAQKTNHNELGVTVGLSVSEKYRNEGWGTPCHPSVFFSAIILLLLLLLPIKADFLVKYDS